MTPIVRVETKSVGCRKPGCSRRMVITHRHHRRCETLFVRGFGHIPQKRVTKRYKKFVKRYESFDPRDVVVLCPWHHCEIHLGYDAVILQDKAIRCKVLRDYTWPQADALMRKLRQLCYEWEELKTPGMDPVECTPSKRFTQVGPLKRRKRKKRKKKK